MARTRFARRGQEGFSLAEMLIGLSVALLVGAAAYTLGNVALQLYAQNFSLNGSHLSARLPMERIRREVQRSGCPPKLLDANGADMPANDIGPAAGIRFCVPADSANYSIASAADADYTTASLTVNAGQAKPRVSDLLVISTAVQSGHPTQAEIINVSGASSPYTLTLKPLKPGEHRPKVGANQPALLVEQGGFVVQAGELRYYYNIPAIPNPNKDNYRVLAQVEAGAIPFSYDKDSNRATNDPGDPRVLQVNLRVLAGRFSKRVSSFNSFLNMKSSIAVRSAYLGSPNNTVTSAYVDCAKFYAIQ